MCVTETINDMLEMTLNIKTLLGRNISVYFLLMCGGSKAVWTEVGKAVLLRTTTGQLLI